MAFFERADERDKLIVCNICNVKCSERSLTTHRMKCADRNVAKFKSGQLKLCALDSGHVVESDKMDMHLEFCTKHQSNLRSEYEKEVGAINNPEVAIVSPVIAELHSSSVGDEWNQAANEEPYIATSMRRLKLS